MVYTPAAPTSATPAARRSGRLSEQERADRKARAMEAIDRYDYWPQETQDPGIWTVTAWREGKTYRVHEASGVCTCQDCAWRGGPCKHWFMVKYHAFKCRKSWERLAANAQGALNAAIRAFEQAADAASDLETLMPQIRRAG